MNETVNYMLNGAITLLLGDIRGSNNRTTFNYLFSTESTKHPSNSFSIRLGILLNILNLWASSKVLIKAVLPYLDHPLKKKVKLQKIDRGIDHEFIDWPLTINQRFNGSRKFIIRKHVKTISTKNCSVISIILQEVIIHIRTLMSLLENDIPDNSYLEIIFSDLRLAEKLISNEVEIKYKFCKNETIDSVAKIKKLFNDCIGSFETLPTDNLLKYAGETEQLLTEEVSLTNQSFLLKKWRDKYLSGDIWLSNKIGLNYNLKKSIPHLYEFWCFSQLIKILLMSKKEKFVQRCLITNKRIAPEYALTDCHYAFFDYRQKKISTKNIQEINNDCMNTPLSILKTTFVEWFIIDYNNYENSIIFDTKFRSWNSKDALQVMGYMTNFGVNKGVVIFNQDNLIPKGNCEVLTTKLHHYISPHHDKKELFVMSLVPNIDHEKNNNEALEMLISKIFI